MISIADQKCGAARRLYRRFARLHVYEPARQRAVWSGILALSNLLVDFALAYVIAKVLFFHDLPVW